METFSWLMLCVCKENVLLLTASKLKCQHAEEKVALFCMLFLSSSIVQPPASTRLFASIALPVAIISTNFNFAFSKFPKMRWYQFLNYFFFVFHTLLIFFNTFGWIFRKTRKGNLVTLLLTAFSWFVLGIWFGWGYCLCTDWHWNVRKQLGYHDTTNSYIQFLAQELTGVKFSSSLVDIVTAVGFFTSLALSIWLNLRDWRLREKRTGGS